MLPPELLGRRARLLRMRPGGLGGFARFLAARTLRLPALARQLGELAPELGGAISLVGFAALCHVDSRLNGPCPTGMEKWYCNDTGMMRVSDGAVSTLAASRVDISQTRIRTVDAITAT